MEGLGRHKIRPYLGKEYRVYVRVVLEPLQNSHSLHLTGATVDIGLPQLFGVRLEFDGRRQHTLHIQVTPHLQCVHIIGENDNLVTSRFMELDQKLTGLEFLGVHAV